MLLPIVRSGTILAALAAFVLLAASILIVGPVSSDDGDGSPGPGAGPGSSGPGADSSGPGGDKGFDGFRPARSKCTCAFLIFNCRCRAVSARSRRRVATGKPASPSVTARRGQIELLALGLTANELAALSRGGFVLVAERPNALLGLSTSRLQVPPGVGAASALRRARSLVPGFEIARNDVYRRPDPLRFRPAGPSCGPSCLEYKTTSWTSAVHNCAIGSRIGVVDTGVDAQHSALKAARLTLRTIRSADRPPSETDHGTAVVSLIAGAPGTSVVGLAHGADVFAADAFHGDGDAARADAFDLVGALDWLASERVSTINLSMTGPANPVLEKMVRLLIERGIVIVAASGLPDSSAKSGYPGRYPGVYAVAAVDARLRPSRLSNRGDYISFAAPGVGLVAARSKDAIGRVEGTSFAAPFVTAAFAIGLRNGRGAADVATVLSETARDLGAKGRDPIFGWGLVQFDRLPGCSL